MPAGTADSRESSNLSTRLLRWLNSIQVLMILLALGTIAAITAFSLVAINLADGPPYSPVSVYEITRIIRGEKILEIPRKEVTRRVVATAPVNDDEAEREIARLLASRLSRAVGDVRIHLQSDQARADAIVAETRLYGDASANPGLYGGFTVYLRRPDGAWDSFERVVDYWQARSVRFWKYGAYYLGIVVVFPLSMLFSSRLTRPVRNFAAAADRMGAGIDDAPVPVEGPTEIRQVAVALNGMQARISRFVRERTALVGAIAHDLRTPLSNLRFRVAGADPKTRASVEDEILHMEQLITSTLDYVDSEGRPPIKEPLDLGSLLQTLADEWSDRGAQVASVNHEKVTLQGDLPLLKRLFVNLIENGLKFGGRVDISYAVDAGVAVIDVVDDGPGIEAEDLPRVFEPFFRTDRSRNRSTGGIGLGLAIATSAARAHGGAIELSNIQEGFRARVRLPIETALES